jgi:hypothetical protein
MKHAIAVFFVLTLSVAQPALADEHHCRSPMSQWQPREAATAHVQRLGISPNRLKIDDGCYEVRGRDSDDNRVELKLDPATLALLEMEIRFRPGADPARYLPGALGQTEMTPRGPRGNPLVTPGTVPEVSRN